MRVLYSCACAAVVAGFARQPAAQAQSSLVADPQPVLSIGAEDRGAPYLFAGIAGALRLGDGILVADCGSSELRFYNSDGLHIRTSGRNGSGPGEFRYLRRVFPAGGDSIGIFDGAARRVSLFTGSGDYSRSFSVPVRFDVLGRMEDGTFVGRAITGPTGDLGIQRLTITLVRLRADGTVVDSVSGLPGIEVLRQANRRMMFSVRMERAGVVAVLANGIAYGDQEAAEFIEFAPDFSIRRRVTSFSKPEPVTAAMKQRWESSRQVMVPDGGVGAIFGAEYAEAAPAYRDIVGGTDGRIWVQDPARPRVYPLVWTAYHNGRAEARLELPPRLFPTQFGTDWVLGVRYVEDGMERVQLLHVRGGQHSGKEVTPRDGEPPAQPRCGAWTAR